MIGSNSTALRQHAYSVFTASRRERESRSDIPESVLNHMASSPAPTRLPMGRVDRATEPKPADSERAAIAGRGGVIEALTPGGRWVTNARLAPAATPEPRASEPTQDDIRRRAYEFFLARQGEPGDPVADWLRAEAELRRERGLA